ncbi:hypothetical protein [Terrabacter carboxydivorans]
MSSFLDNALKSLNRASRMLDDLAAHSHSGEAFADRLPYVLDLLAGVRRQLDAAVKECGHLSGWWKDQWTPERKALSELRNAQLKRLETSEAPRSQTRTNVPAGEWRGHRVSEGDTVSWIEWYFVDGRYEGQPVLSVLAGALDDLRGLIDEVRIRLHAEGVTT